MDGSSHGFDFTAAMRLLCSDMVTRLSELGHIDLELVAIGLCQTRQSGSHGLYASLTPLKFEAGASEQVLEGRRYGVQSLCDLHGRELLYILSFYLPRFLNTSLEEKLSTVLHELWHISPEFDGDLRRHAGRCYAHGSSQQEYDAQMDRLAQRWLALDPPGHLYDLLAVDFAELEAEHGKVVGARWPTPKLLPL
jgi:predicted metallopeptidase